MSRDIVDKLLEDDFDPSEVEQVASQGLESLRSIGWSRLGQAGDTYWLKMVAFDDKRGKPLLFKLIFFEKSDDPAPTVQAYKRTITGWDLFKFVEMQPGESLAQLGQRAEAEVRRRVLVGENIDPEEIEQVAQTSMPPRFTDIRGMPIAVGDVVLVWSNLHDNPEEPEFMGRVVSTERGFLQVQDSDGNVIDQYPDSVEVAPRDQWYRMESERVEKWTGVDLDGTLAKSGGKFDPDKVGEPIQTMVNRVKKWLEQGKKVKIFTARASTDGFDPEPIKAWCKKHLGQELEITCEKDIGMEDLWDDRAVQVIKNTGEVVEAEVPDFDPAEVEAVARSPVSPQDLGFEPADPGHEGKGSKWTKVLGVKPSGREVLHYWAELFLPDESNSDYRIMVQMSRRNRALVVTSVSYHLLGWKDTPSLLEVQDYLDDFKRRFDLSVEEAMEPIAPEEPEEIEQVAHAALRSYDASWFKDTKFLYMPEDGTWYKEEHDPYYPGWIYRIRVFPFPVSRSEGHWLYDVEWSYHAPTEPPNDRWDAFHWDRERGIEGVAAGYQQWFAKVLTGEMRWETEKI